MSYIHHLNTNSRAEKFQDLTEEENAPSFLLRQENLSHKRQPSLNGRQIELESIQGEASSSLKGTRPIETKDLTAKVDKTFQKTSKTEYSPSQQYKNIAEETDKSSLSIPKYAVPSKSTPTSKKEKITMSFPDAIATKKCITERLRDTAIYLEEKGAIDGLVSRVACQSKSKESLRQDVKEAMIGSRLSLTTINQIVGIQLNLEEAASHCSTKTEEQ